MLKLIALLPFTKGTWGKTSSQEWEGLNFIETVLDWSVLPKPSYGQLYTEMAHLSGNPDEHEISIRLMYMQKPQQFIGVKGSEITHIGCDASGWQLLKSEIFVLPTTKSVSCLWIEGKTTKGGVCAVALATLAIFEE